MQLFLNSSLCKLRICAHFTSKVPTVFSYKYVRGRTREVFKCLKSESCGSRRRQTLVRCGSLCSCYSCYTSSHCDSETCANPVTPPNTVSLHILVIPVTPPHTDLGLTATQWQILALFLLHLPTLNMRLAAILLHLLALSRSRYSLYDSSQACTHTPLPDISWIPNLVHCWKSSGNRQPLVSGTPTHEWMFQV